MLPNSMMMTMMMLLMVMVIFFEELNVLQCHDDADGDAYGEPGALQCEENEASIAVSPPPLSAPSPLSAKKT